MKNLRILILVCISTTVLGISDLKAQSEKQIVLIRAAEYFLPNRTSSEMVTITPDGVGSVTKLESINYKNYGEITGKNGVIIQQEIIKWQQQGFVITNLSTDGGDSGQRTFIIMTKE